MYFKDRKYYIAKAKQYLGLALTALAFDVFVMLMVLCA